MIQYLVSPRERSRQHVVSLISEDLAEVAEFIASGRPGEFSVNATDGAGHPRRPLTEDERTELQALLAEDARLLDLAPATPSSARNAGAAAEVFESSAGA